MILKLTTVNPRNVFVIAKEERIRGTRYFQPLGINFMPNSKLDKNSYKNF